MIYRFYKPSPLALILAFAWLAGACSTAAQKTAAPGSPEQWGDLYVQALLSDSVPEREAIVRQIFCASTLAKPGVPALLGQIERLHGEFTPGEYHHTDLMVAEFTPDDIRRILHVYLRKQGAPMWRDIQIRLDPAPPYKIQSLVFIAEVAEPVSLPNGDIAEKITLDWLDGYVDKLVRENDLAGSALVVKHDKVLFEKYFGFADDARSARVDQNTLFNLGSGNKMFTALAIVKLQEEGKLQFTDPLSKWFPDFPNAEWANKATIHHLLSHTSGVGEYWTPDNKAEMLRCTSWQQLLPIIYRTGFQFEPGSEAGYSNSNFILLGAIIEKVSGRDYFDVIQDLIYTPAGMTQSGTYEYDRRVKPLAVPLTRDPERGWKEAPHGRRGSPAGGGYSTVRDMWLFARSLKATAFVSAASFKTMITDKTAGLKDAFPYGYGFILQKNAGVFSYGHGGIASGINLEFRYFPGPDVTLVVFSNQDNGAFDDLKKNLVRLITGER